jgi:hypothetical protein
MSNFIYDPRPLDPPSYWEHELSDKVEWCVTHTKIKFTRDGLDKKINTEYGEGDLVQAMQMVANIYDGVAEDYKIEIDATEVAYESDRRNPICLTIKYEPKNFISWEVTDKDSGSKETGTDPEELFGWVEYMMNENKRFKIEFDTIDPTPQYLWDDSGGESPITADEIYARAFQEKKEAWG